MTYHKPVIVRLSCAMGAIAGDLGKPFRVYIDFRYLLLLAMTPGAYEADE